MDFDAECNELMALHEAKAREGRGLQATLISFREGFKQGSLTVRLDNGQEDKEAAATEAGLFLACLAADEAVFAFDAFFSMNTNIEKASDDPERIECLTILQAQSTHTVARIYPYRRNDDGTFLQWVDADNSSIDAYDGAMSGILMKMLSVESRPFMITSMIGTLQKKGHRIELHPETLDKIPDL